MKHLKVTLLLLTIFVLAHTAFSGNLLQGGDMEAEDGWTITDFNDNGSLEYDFGYTDDTPAFGKGGCLHIYQGEDAGQFLLWQRVTLIAGQKYRVTGAISLLDFNPGPEGGGNWYQMYVSQEEVDEGAGEYNPTDDKILDVGEGWDRESGFFNTLWEDANLSTAVETVPYFIAPGTAGEEVEMTVGIKFGQYWSDYTGAYFEILVDEVGIYAVNDAVNEGGAMDDENAWNITDFNDNGSLEYEFGFVDEAATQGDGGCLHIYQGEDACQLLLWQTIPVIGGETYRITGAVTLIDFTPGPEGGGNWYQMYISEEPVDEGAGEYNPTDDKVLDIGEGWDRESGFFDGFWEVENLSQVLENPPYWTAPGEPGEEIDVTFAIKCGQYWSDYSGTSFEVLIDEVYLLPVRAGGGTAVKDDKPVTPVQFSLSDNYPNPFNPTTTINYTLDTTTNVKLTVFDVLGKEVTTLVNEVKNHGSYSVKFDASELSNGIYFYQLKAGNKIMTKKLTLLK